MTDTQKDTPTDEKARPKAKAKAPPAPNVTLRTDDMKSSYCNVCNATSTREEVVINFGLNQNWDRSATDVEIDIQHRIIMSPHAAVKLRETLNDLIEAYEGRYGPLKD